MSRALIVAYCLATPLLVLWLCWRFPLLRKLGGILIAYIIGCAVGLTGIIPADGNTLLSTIATAAIPLAIPLMLLSSDVKAWVSLAPSFAKSTTAGVLGCVLAIVTGFLLFGAENPDIYARIGGMLTGLYTGGTANQASLIIALGIPDDIYLVSHAYSIAVSAIYLIFVIIFGQRVLSLILPRFKHDAPQTTSSHDATIESHDDELFLGLFRRDNLPHLFRALTITIAIIILGGAMAYGIQRLFPHANLFQAVFILLISLLAVLAAQHPRVRSLSRTYEAGEFFILIFSIAVSSQVTTDMLHNINPAFFAFITVATLGSLLMHVLLNALMRIDTDTTLVTSIALICSPPFVPVMAGALGNKAVIGPGIAVGLAGYAFGTYLGFAVAHLLMLLA